MLTRLFFNHTAFSLNWLGAGAAKKPRNVKLKPKRKIDWRAKLEQLQRLDYGLILALSSAIVLLVAVVYSMPMWTFKKLEVRGDFALLDEQRDIRQPLAWLYQENFVLLDLDRVAEQLAAKNEVASFNLRRQFPDTLLVNIREAEPIARWNNEHLLSATGQVLTTQRAFQASDLLDINGQYHDLPELLDTVAVIKSRLATVYVELQIVTVNPAGSLILQLDNGWQVAIGNQQHQQRVDKLTQLLRVLPTQSVDTIDMRHHGGVAVTWQQGGEHAARKG